MPEAPPRNSAATPADQLSSALQTQNLDLSRSNVQSSIPLKFNRWIELIRGSAMANLTINGKAFDVDVEADTPLLWAIRENAGLTGTKYGCGIAQCGACTVHIDGVAMRSCGMLVSDAVGKQITTIEGLAANGALHKVQQAWIAKDVPQCGYCQSGMIMAGWAPFQEKAKPTHKEMRAGHPPNCPPGPLPRGPRGSPPPAETRRRPPRTSRR